MTTAILALLRTSGLVLYLAPKIVQTIRITSHHIRAKSRSSLTMVVERRRRKEVQEPWPSPCRGMYPRMSFFLNARRDFFFLLFFSASDLADRSKIVLRLWTTFAQFLKRTF